MKRYFFAVFAIFTILLAGCAKETTYTFTDKSGYGNTMNAHYTLYEYDANGSTIAHNQINLVETGKQYVFTASSRAEKVKVKIKIQDGDYPTYLWVQQIYRLNKGEDTGIVIEANTVVGSNEP